MKRELFAAAASLFVATSAGSQPYGMGPGMMGGYEEGGMSPGMTRGYADLKLTTEQRDKIAEIQSELFKKRSALMSGMHEQRQQAFRSGKADEATMRRSFAAMQAAQKEMFEASLDARKRMEAVLTPEQRKQLPRGAGGFGMMGMGW